MGPVLQEIGQRGQFGRLVVDLCPADSRPSDAALTEIGFPLPDHVIAPGCGSPGERTARVLRAFDELVERTAPAVVLIAGDSDATLGCALTAAKRSVPVARLEAGLRSWDWGSREEVNRVLADRLGDALFVDSLDARENLLAEGVGPTRVHYAGNTMVDWLRAADAGARVRRTRLGLGLKRGEYVLVVLRRRATLDGPGRSARLHQALGRLAARVPVVLPANPRTAEASASPARPRPPRGLHSVPPLGFLDYLSLAADAGAVVTDAGSIQEETSALGVPCFTLRSATERRVTLTHGTNVLLGDDPTDLDAVTLRSPDPAPAGIPRWDGRSAGRVAEILVANFALQGGAGFGA